MATYAIGDVQGCYDELRALLGRVGFNRAHDRLWFVGDLVNRGPKSLEVLRLVRELGDCAIVVLGNHDLHLITQHEGFERKPERWEDALAGWDRLRVIVNAMTRMRFCTPEGAMEFRATAKTAPAGYVPWYEARTGSEPAIVFGHWSALGLRLTERIAALDTGCVWGR